MDNITSIPECFRGQSVLITGGTGFMGKVLIEKLLRSCPDIERIYVLIRSKKGRNPADRIITMTNLPLFDKLKEENPAALKKIIPITANIMELGLGMSSSDRTLLQDTVTTVFHAAASVRFDDPLCYAVLMNVRGTREVVELACGMHKLKAFVHVSTTYCVTDRKDIEEVIYPVKMDWRKVIEIAENTNQHMINILTPKIMGNYPNTYTFTKALAEHVVKELGCDLPTVIFRPSIVISSLADPMPGWVDNFNGPVGLMVAGGKGFLRVVFADPEAAADYMPVDAAIKLLIVAAWQRSFHGNSSTPAVYNSSSNNIKTVTMNEVIQLGHACTEAIPLDNILWVPGGKVTNCWSWYLLNAIFLHLIPGLLIDGLLRLSGRKPMLVRLHRSIFMANTALAYFLNNSWNFKNTNAQALRRSVLPADKEAFGLDDIEEVDEKEYFRNCIIGARLYLLKEGMESLPEARRHYKRMCWIERASYGAVISMVLWLLVRGWLF